MATVAKELMTAHVFYAWVQRAENKDRFFELERGEVVETPPPGKYHGYVCGNVSRLLGNHVAELPGGYICTNDAGFQDESAPDTVRALPLLGG